MSNQDQNKPMRNRLMSESIPLNPASERTFSIFDVLINSRRNNGGNSLGNLNGGINRDQTDSSNQTSTLLENLITEYLISLPSSLDEFYKVMGEIYVQEILKLYPSYRSPVDLMRETLLGPNSSLNNSQNNARIMNALIQHFSQSRQSNNIANLFENSSNLSARNDTNINHNHGSMRVSQSLLNNRVAPKIVPIQFKSQNPQIVSLLSFINTIG